MHAAECRRRRRCILGNAYRRLHRLTASFLSPFLPHLSCQAKPARRLKKPPGYAEAFYLSAPPTQRLEVIVSTPDEHRFPDSTALSPPSMADSQGIRSFSGIRWLLFVGALVVVVSITRLAAGQWQMLPPALQFLILCAGSLAIHGAGEVSRRRLRLPTAAGALLGLFAVSVPVLAWGAGHQGLWAEPLGSVAFGVGMAGLWLGVRRMFQQVYDYRQPWLSAGFIVLASMVPVLGTGLIGAKAGAVIAGLLTVALCRHLNRFFFHRDRIQGMDRPIQALPFVSVLGLLAANTLAASADMAHWALTCFFMALALVNAGEEYFRARTLADGRQPTTWPKRSKGLLVSGFAFGAVAVTLALGTFHPWIVVLVTGGSAAVLARWSLRYQRTPAYGVALPLGLIALHTAPALFSGLKNVAVSAVGQYFGYQGLTAGASTAALGELSLLAALVTAGWALRRRRWTLRVTPGMLTCHGVAVALLSLWTLGLATSGIEVLAYVAPAVTILCAIAAGILGRAQPLWTAHWALLASVFSLFMGGLEPSSQALGLAAINSGLAVAFAWRRVKTSKAAAELSALQAAAAVAALPIAGVATFLSPGLALPAMPLWTWAAALPAFMALAWHSGRPLMIQGTTTLFWTFAGVAAFIQWGNGAATPLAAIQATTLIASWFALRWLRARSAADSAVPAEAPRLHFLRAVWPLSMVGSLVALVLMPAGSLFWLAAGLLSSMYGLSLADLSLKAGPPLSPLAVPQDELRSMARVIGLCCIAMAPVLLLTAALPGLQGLPTLTLWIFAAFGLRWAIGRPRGIYLLEHARGRLWPADYPGRQQLTAAAGRALKVVAGFVLVAGFSFTGPWILAAVLLATACFGLDPRTRWAQLWSILALIQLSVAGAHDTGLLAQIELALPQPWTLLRFLIGLCLGAGLDRLAAKDRPTFPAAVQVLGCLACAVMFPALWATAWIALACCAALALHHALGAWQDDNPRRFDLALAWVVAPAMGLASFDSLAAASTLAWIAVPAAFGCQILSEWIRADTRPRLSGHLDLLGRPMALVGAAACWVGGGSVLPGLLAALFFGLRVKSENVARPAIIAGACFVPFFSRWLSGMEGLGWELHLAGPGLALIGLAAQLRRRAGEDTSHKLFSAGASLLYAVPLLAMVGGLTWANQAVLLLLAVAFGALSFQIRSRSLLWLSTGAVLIDCAVLLFRMGRAEPLLLWVAGLVLGLALMAVAAWLERGRETALQQLRLWQSSLRSWS